MSGSVVKLLTTILVVLGPGLTAQSVISARSGLVHFFEGTVYVDNQRLEPHLGRFAMIPDGAEIRTEQGRAEILLTPGVFLRMGENSGVRMLDSDIENTGVELLRGSAAIDCTQSGPGASLTLKFRQWNTHFLNKGQYRVDSEPPMVRVRTGKAEVASGDQPPVTIERGMNLPLQAVLVPERTPVEAEDTLSDWAIGRRQSIMADDAISAQIDEDPVARGDLYAGVPNVSYFPLIGLTSVYSGYGTPYDPYLPYQAGFNSIYLPGYVYRPLIYIGAGGYRGLLSGTGAYPSTVYGSPRTGISPVVPRTGVPIHIPRPVVGPTAGRPAAPTHAPISHSIGGGGHAGGHAGHGR